MQKLLESKAGWKLLALICAVVYAVPVAILLLFPWKILNLGIAAIGLLWIASLFCYAFDLRVFPKSVWVAVAVVCACVTFYTGSWFLGYRATRLVVIDLDTFGIVRTLAEMAGGTLLGLLTVVPVLRLAGLLKERQQRNRSQLAVLEHTFS